MSPVLLTHRTSREAARAILAGGFRDGPVVPTLGRGGVWLSDKALDIDPFVLLHDQVARNGQRWAVAYGLSGAFAGWLHLLVFTTTGLLTDLAAFWATPFALGETPPLAFRLAARAALLLVGGRVLQTALDRLASAELAAFPRLRIAHPSQLSILHGNGPQSSLLGLRFPDEAALTPWEVAGSSRWREWLIPADVVNATAGCTLLADEESDLALGPVTAFARYGELGAVAMAGSA